MSQYSIAGVSLATAATANHVGAQFWNPAAAKSVRVTAVSWFKTVATVDNISLIRSSVRGATPTTTVTPDLDSDWEREIVNQSASVLELATFGTQPTLAGPALFRTHLPAAIGSGFILPLPGRGVTVPFGTGLCIATELAVVLQPGHCTFFFEE